MNTLVQNHLFEVEFSFTTVESAIYRIDGYLLISLLSLVPALVASYGPILINFSRKWKQWLLMGMGRKQATLL